MAAEYFVSPRGDDTHPGTAPDLAWRTPEAVNRARFRPGDRVFFEGGATFPGTLLLTAEDAGASNAPVTLGSFGSGRATLAAGEGTGITVENAGNLVIENLVVLGAGRTRNTGHGIRCDQTIPDAPRLRGLTLTNLEVRGFGLFGVLVSGVSNGFERVRISHCRLHDNLRGGMEVAGRLPWDASGYAHADVRVEHCLAHDNTGDPEYLKNHSGSGIVLYQVDGGVVEHCRAWNNGALCRSSGGGGVGLWACASRRVVIQHCESFANRTSGADGGGFDLDGGCEDCVLQYNFSHDNDGPGLMVYSYPYASHRDRGNVVRFNVSWNDSRKGSRYAGLFVRTDGPPMTGLEIHHNTVVVGGWTDQAVRIHASQVEARLHHNLFLASSNAWPLRVEAPSERVRFENNLYWRTDGPTQIGWGETVFERLADWRARTSQETVQGHPVGVFADPLLHLLPPPNPPVETDPASLLRGFQPRPDSPAAGAGIRPGAGDAPVSSIPPILEPGTRDLLGTVLDGRVPLGALAAPVVR